MFATRSFQKELLDEDNIPFDDLKQNLKELEFINTWLGGHRVTIKGLEKLKLNPHQTYTILDIGSGGGDTLKFVAQWARKKKMQVRLVGIDIKPEATAYAAAQCHQYPEISFLTADYRTVHTIGQEADIFIASLFCHHLTNPELIELLSYMKNTSRIGFVINDLHRNLLAYYSIRWLTVLFSKSYLVKHDAPLSVLRGFSKSDWLMVLNTAEVSAKVHWLWAFRWLVVYAR